MEESSSSSTSQRMLAFAHVPRLMKLLKNEMTHIRYGNSNEKHVSLV